ncbi:MAG: amidase [Deltaproteobacteria bacterium]|nr:MAG: amidase [Deltaproteobacteria bacterium]
MTTLGLRSARDLIEALESGGVSSRELLEHYLERIERLGPAVNSVVTLDTERARKRADQADAARRAGQSWGPLHGLPMTVKDCFETAGLRTTAGAGELSDHVPTVNAVAVQRLLDAGAIVFGKTNTPTWAMDWQTHNKLFGTTNNPWDLERTCGGSSGGSAASVAAGFTALELGSDIGGSVRIPSHCCGVFGHKPSWGIVPVRGHIPGPPGSLIEDDINVIGPLARSADDLEIALRVLMGPLEDRAKGWRLELPEPRAERLQDFRVAAWLDDEACPVDSSVLDILKSTVEALRKTGVSVDDRARPPVSMSEAVTLYQRMLAPIVTSTMTDEQFSALTAVTNSPPSEPAGWIERFTESVGVRHRDWLKLHQQREQMRAGWASLFESFDVMLCPVSPLPAIRHDHREPQFLRTIEVNGATRPYTDHMFWMGAIGLVWLPATVAPVGRTAQDLPVGIQIVAPFLEDFTSIRFAQLLSSELGGFEAPPRYEEPDSPS